MEETNIKFSFRNDEEIKKFKIVKEFWKFSKYTNVLTFLINEKYQEIQKLPKKSHNIKSEVES